MPSTDGAAGDVVLEAIDSLAQAIAERTELGLPLLRRSRDLVEPYGECRDRVPPFLGGFG